MPVVGMLEMTCGYGLLNQTDVQSVYRTVQLEAWPAKQIRELLIAVEMEMPERRLSLSHGWQEKWHQTTGWLWELPMENIVMIKEAYIG